MYAHVMLHANCSYTSDSTMFTLNTRGVLGEVTLVCMYIIVEHPYDLIHTCTSCEPIMLCTKHSSLQPVFLQRSHQKCKMNFAASL